MPSDLSLPATASAQGPALSSQARHGDPHRRDLHWFLDKGVAAFVFVGGVSAIVFILGIFAFIPFLGILLGVPAFFLGLKGLKKVARFPEVKGKVHAWIGILAGQARHFDFTHG